jgi:hypothetical protein
VARECVLSLEVRSEKLEMRKKILLVVLFLFAVVMNNIQAQQTALVYNSDMTATEAVLA